MAGAILEELRHKADIYEQTGLISVMDYCIAALKSDKLLTDDLVADLKAAVVPLENVPADQKDWHPGSNKQALDLVHPSVWPLVYGKTRILPNGRVGIEDALDHCGGGYVIPELLPMEAKEGEYFSTRFQCLPSDVSITPDGKANIDSYVNNVHPTHHATLFPTLNRLIKKALPAWDVLYRWPQEFSMQRLKTAFSGVKCRTRKLCEVNHMCMPANRPLNQGEEPRDDDELYEDSYEESERGRLDMAWFKSTHTMDLPDPDPAELPVLIGPNDNEHICATALYCYDSENVTHSRLDFRTRANRESLALNVEYEHNDSYAIQRTFAMDFLPSAGASTSPAIQLVGSVLTRPGRALFFPNLYQHRVSPCKLIGPTKPGHRKIVALFLVDPKIPVISTANVPPQRQDWWKGVTQPDLPVSKLPAELIEMVADLVNFPYGKKEADRMRDELMKERSASVKKFDAHLNNFVYGFCEH
ncbi:uncharacterized protein E0L32_006918 [Thyridium curvatum]|uniref:DUF4246 domain-containing protein n=1 Tax=Thyridium curvatum TaxID=1093900 RepID=A0A507B5E6_9PEZI|nr:uncharacterized protein E0L32_006918 [Thyridium curvatum]TPX12271.1 hypothetical protein E0L32_006918 [Thyridium curvatum]